MSSVNPAKALAGQLLANLEAAQDEVGEELRERLQSLAEASSEYYLAGLAGLADPADGAILKARAATLQAAGAIKVAEVVRETLELAASTAVGVLFQILV